MTDYKCSADWHTAQPCGWPTCGCDPHAKKVITALEAEGWRQAGWTCKVRAAGATDPPQDCDWPVCDCDPVAAKVVAALEEGGLLVDPHQERIDKEALKAGELDLPDGPEDTRG